MFINKFNELLCFKQVLLSYPNTIVQSNKCTKSIDNSIVVEKVPILPENSTVVDFLSH